MSCWYIVSWRPGLAWIFWLWCRTRLCIRWSIRKSFQDSLFGFLEVWGPYSIHRFWMLRDWLYGIVRQLSARYWRSMVKFLIRDQCFYLWTKVEWISNPADQFSTQRYQSLLRGHCCTNHLWPTRHSYQIN